MMKEMYETRISDARWILYDIPGNIGWILYMICLILILRNGINWFVVVSIIPMILMLSGII